MPFRLPPATLLTLQYLTRRAQPGYAEESYNSGRRRKPNLKMQQTTLHQKTPKLPRKVADSKIGTQGMWRSLEHRVVPESEDMLRAGTGHTTRASAAAWAQHE